MKPNQPREFAAMPVKVEGGELRFNLEIRQSAEPFVQVVGQGDEYLLEKIDLSVKDGMVIIKPVSLQEQTAPSRNIFIGRNAYGPIVTGDNSSVRVICYDNGQKEDATRHWPKVLLSVPIGVDLDITGVGGKITVGHIQNNLRLTHDTRNNAKLEKVQGRCWLQATGNGLIFADDVSGELLIIAASSDGNVRVKGGKVDELSIQSTNTAKAKFHGAAEKARLSASDTSAIEVECVNGDLSQMKSVEAVIDVWERGEKKG